MRHVLFSLAVFALACDEDPDAGSDTGAEVADTDVEVSDTDAEVSDDDDSDDSDDDSDDDTDDLDDDSDDLDDDSDDLDDDSDDDTDDLDDDTDDLDDDSEVSQSTSADDLLYIREEEKLARDVYAVFADSYGTRLFSNIGSAEQSHMDALLPHIDRLGLVDPIVDDTAGVFVDENLQDLYADFVTQGSQDLVGALTVGATIEDLDIIDLALAIESTDDLALAETYDALMCGSRNHLRSFIGQLDRRGADYTPQYISQALFDDIIGSDNEQCGQG